MLGVILQMAAFIGLGLLWRLWQPAGLDAESTRRAITGLVFHLLLPALVLKVLWEAKLGLDTLRIAAVGAGGVFFGMGLGWLGSRLLRLSPLQTGAVLLATGFPNTTYLGLPVLEATFGPWARGIAIQYDVFACSPLVLTLGIFLAGYYGERDEEEGPFLRLVKAPPLWAAALAVSLNLSAIPLPPWLGAWLEALARTVVPLMVISLGMGLSARGFRRASLLPLAWITAVQLFLIPLFALLLARRLGLSGEVLQAVVLEAAMPAMVLGVVLCDRFGLDTPLYAASVTLTTALSLLTLPLWHHLAGP